MGPDGPAAFALYWRAQRIPFVGLPDPDHKVALRYRQEVNVFKLGRMPLLLVLDGEGLIRFIHFAASMSDIPENRALLRAIDELNPVP